MHTPLFFPSPPWIIRHPASLFFLLISIVSHAQPGDYMYYYSAYSHNNGWLCSISTEENYHCTDCWFYRHADIGQDFSSGISFDPQDSLYILSYFPKTEIFQVNTVSATPTLVMTAPDNAPKMGGMVAMGGGIFYSVTRYDSDLDSLYRWDTNAGTVTSVGKLNFPPTGDMWAANGSVYYISWKGTLTMNIVKANLEDPGNSELLIGLPFKYFLWGLTATSEANIFQGFESNFFEDTWIVNVNVIDGSVTGICPVAKIFGGHAALQMTSKYEHDIIPVDAFIDLDCNDSSLAEDSDYNSIPFDCFTIGGAPIADEDTRIRMDAPLTSMTLTLLDPLDGVKEWLTSTGNADHISVSGSGSTSITLTNEGGAIVTDFLKAMQYIRYFNQSLKPTGGMRTVAVLFETESGTISNIGNAYINVAEIDQIELELGDPIQFCEGGSETLYAGPILNTYIWSTGETTNGITVDAGGMYSVTVSNPFTCPNADTIQVDELPVYSVFLSGDEYSCPGAEVNFLLTTDAPFPLNVEITSITLGSEWYTLDGEVSFSDFPFYNTEYFINEIIPTEPACLDLADPDQVIEILPDIETQAMVSICQGDSLLLGSIWVSDTGIYVVEYISIGGCDSIVTYLLSVLPAIDVSVDQITCDPDLAGVFISHLHNPEGCDTILRQTILYHAPDTTQLFISSCRQSAVGTAMQTLPNMNGCDSVIITTTSWIPPADSTFVEATSCDPSQWGAFPQWFSGADGCDSMVLLQVLDGNPVSTFLQTTSCDSASLGVFEQHYLTAQLCDSIVTTEVTFSTVITTSIARTTCDPDDAGTFVYSYTSVAGCDSIVTETITLLPSGTTYVTGTSCDPAATGSFVHSFTNVYGCDSIVHETITLLPESETILSSTTCIASEAGTFVHILTNQYGCDSMVTSVVVLVPPDTSRVFQMSCDPLSVGILETLFTTPDGCDSLVIETTALHPLPALSLSVISDYNGYAVSCHGMQDGAVSAAVTGVEPFDFRWSTGDHTNSLSGIAAGNYSVTLTDANGCETQEAVSLHEPAPLEISLESQQPNCFRPYGSVLAFEHGGVMPYMFSLDGSAFQPDPDFTALDPGIYTIYVEDRNLCRASASLLLQAPGDMSVDLGPDKEIAFGDTTLLQAVVSFPADSIAQVTWFALPGANCQYCLVQTVSPETTTSYAISVMDHAGCIVQDTLIVRVIYDNDIHFPNVFSPNGDGINDRFLVSGSDELAEIESLHIYDRWGNLVFANQQFQPDDLDASWDGKHRGKAMDPAVFVYTAIVKWKNGIKEAVKGDITLMR